MLTGIINGTFDNREAMCREWWLNGVLIYWQSSGLIAKMGRTVFGAYPDVPGANTASQDAP